MKEKTREFIDYRWELNFLFKSRCERNPSYGLRAFARDLGIPSSTLSPVLRGKRHFSAKNLDKITLLLNLSKERREEILARGKKRGSQEQGRELEGHFLSHQKEERFISLREDEFLLIARWYFLAILTLANRNDCPFDAKIIGKCLGISKEKAMRALEVLIRLKQIERKEGLLIRVGRSIRTSQDLSSIAIKNYQMENLELMKKALYETPVKEREITTMTFALEEKMIPKAKALITQFKRDFVKLLENPKGEAIYSLNVALYPLAKIPHLKKQNKKNKDK